MMLTGTARGLAFLSFCSRQDETDPRKVASYLEKRMMKASEGAKCAFVDMTSLTAGSWYDQELMHVASECCVFVLLFTPEYFDSGYCRKELLCRLKEDGSWKPIVVILSTDYGETLFGSRIELLGCDLAKTQSLKAEGQLHYLNCSWEEFAGSTEKQKEVALVLKNKRDSFLTEMLAQARLNKIPIETNPTARKRHVFQPRVCVIGYCSLARRVSSHFCWPLNERPWSEENGVLENYSPRRAINTVVYIG
jgi:hypothetical protein